MSQYYDPIGIYMRPLVALANLLKWSLKRNLAIKSILTPSAVNFETAFSRV